MEQNENENVEVVDDSMDTTKNKFLTLNVGEEVFGLEIAYISEIISITEITKVPKSPDYVKGIVNLRGDIVPVIDIRLRFKIEEKEYDADTCIVVIEQEGFNIGVIVDNVSDVKSIKPENINPPPSAKLKALNKYIKNIGQDDEEVILLLDIDKLLYEDEAEIVSTN